MRTYRVLVIGMGKRGLHHATFFKANPRFELIGISSRDSARLQPPYGHNRTWFERGALPRTRDGPISG